MRSIIPVLNSIIEKYKIIDFGGGGGYAYWQIKRYLQLMQIDRKIQWIVVETDKMVESCRELSNDELSFISFEKWLKWGNKENKNTAFYSSSAIQYVPDSINFLKKLVAEKRFERIFITRTPFSNNVKSEIFSIQKTRLSNNGPGSNQKIKDVSIEYPITIMPLKQIQDIISEHYNIKIIMKEDEYIASKNVIADCYSIYAIKR